MGSDGEILARVHYRSIWYNHGHACYCFFLCCIFVLLSIFGEAFFFFLVLQLFSGVAWKDKEFMHKPAFYMDISTLLAAKVWHSSY